MQHAAFFQVAATASANRSFAVALVICVCVCVSLPTYYYLLLMLTSLSHTHKRATLHIYDDTGTEIIQPLYSTVCALVYYVLHKLQHLIFKGSAYKSKTEFQQTRPLVLFFYLAELFD